MIGNRCNMGMITSIQHTPRHSPIHAQVGRPLILSVALDMAASFHDVWTPEQDIHAISSDSMHVCNSLALRTPYLAHFV